MWSSLVYRRKLTASRCFGELTMLCWRCGMLPTEATLSLIIRKICGTFAAKRFYANELAVFPVAGAFSVIIQDSCSFNGLKR